MMIMDLDCGIELPLDLFGVVYVLWYKYYLMYSGLGSSVAERVSSKSKVPSSILGSGRYFHWKLNVTLILYIYISMLGFVSDKRCFAISV